MSNFNALFYCHFTVCNRVVIGIFKFYYWTNLLVGNGNFCFCNSTFRILKLNILSHTGFVYCVYHISTSNNLYFVLGSED